MLFDYLFIEKCRLCRAMIPSQISLAKTVCDSCWAPFAAEQARIDLCTLSDGSGITVAHAVSYEKAMKTLIYRLKYDQDRFIAADLGILLYKAFCKLLTEIDAKAPVVLVPIPLSLWRQIKRGFNQSELLARQVCQQEKASDSVSDLHAKLNLTFDSKLLSRRIHTKPQHKLNKTERANNLQGAFECRAPAPTVRSANLILIDDIHTSGATIAEAARCLKASGWPKIFAITVARANLNQHNDLGF